MLKIADRDVHLDNVYDCLEAIEMDFNKALSIDQVGVRTFCIDFCDLDAKKYFMSSIAKSFSEVYKTYALVQDSIKVTVGKLPLQIKDNVIINYLRKFGEVTDEEVVYKQHYKYKTYLCERVYTVNKLIYELPSFTWINGRQLSIKCRRQPQTCKLCDKKDHTARNCPLKKIYEEGMENVVVELDKTSENLDVTEGKGLPTESYRDMLTKGKGFRKPVLNGKNIVNGWNNGGFRPNGFRPQWRSQNRTWKGQTQVNTVSNQTQSREKPRISTLAEYMPKGSGVASANGSKPTDGKRDKVVLKKNGAMRTIIIPKNYKRRTAEHVRQEEALVNQVDEKVDEIGRVIGDSMFDREDVDVSKVVQKNLAELMDICKEKDDEIDFMKQMTDPSTYNIKAMFEKDMEMLANCQERIGLPVGSRLRSPAFQNLMRKFFENLEMKETARKRPPSSPAGSTPDRPKLSKSTSSDNLVSN